MTTRRLTGAALAALTTLALAACTGGGSPAPDGGATTTSSTTEPTDQTTTDATEDATDTDEEPDAVTIPECEGMVLEEGTTISGALLADCMAAAMILAGSGSQVLTTSEGVTEVDFEWTPQINVYARGTLEFVIRGDDGWLLMDGAWVRGNPGSSDPLEMQAGNILELARAFGDPQGTVLLFTQTDWAVVEHGDVPASGGVSSTGWHLEAQGAVNLFGVSMSPMQLWLGDDYLGIYFEGTGSAMGITETSSNLYTQWGEPVDIPDVGE